MIRWLTNLLARKKMAAPTRTRSRYPHLPALPPGARWDDSGWDFLEDPLFTVTGPLPAESMRLGDEIEELYRQAKTPGSKAWKACKLACRRQIAIAPQMLQIRLAEQAANKEFDFFPHHPGYSRLAQLLYKEGDHASAIMVAEEAIRAGWEPSAYESRIRLCRKKMASGNVVGTKSGRQIPKGT